MPRKKFDIEARRTRPLTIVFRDRSENLFVSEMYWDSSRVQNKRALVAWHKEQLGPQTTTVSLSGRRRWVWDRKLYRVFVACNTFTVEVDDGPPDFERESIAMQSYCEDMGLPYPPTQWTLDPSDGEKL